MDDFIDLEGASGAKYRFRLWPDGRHHPPMAGNFACIRRQGKRVAVLLVGESLDLSRLRDELAPRLKERPTVIYTRLNVSRAIRNAEHQDLTARYASEGMAAE
jgi:hypothetical protein